MYKMKLIIEPREVVYLHETNRVQLINEIRNAYREQTGSVTGLREAVDIYNEMRGEQYAEPFSRISRQFGWTVKFQPWQASDLR